MAVQTFMSPQLSRRRARKQVKSLRKQAINCRSELRARKPVETRCMLRSTPFRVWAISHATGDVSWITILAGTSPFIQTHNRSSSYRRHVEERNPLGATRIAPRVPLLAPQFSRVGELSPPALRKDHMRVPFAYVTAIILTGLVVAGCGGITDPSQNKVETLSNVVQPQGFGFVPFTVSKPGEYSVT